MKEDLQGFARLIRSNGDFRRLWVSHMISMMGDWLSYIAVSVISVQHGGGAFAVGMVMFVPARSPTGWTARRCWWVRTLAPLC